MLGSFAMTKRKVSAEVRAYLAKIGTKGGTHSSGARERASWQGVPASERSRRMRAVVRARWAKPRGEVDGNAKSTG